MLKCAYQSWESIDVEFHYNYIKNKYGNYSRLLLAESLMYVIKAEDVYEDFIRIKKCLILVVIQISQAL